MIIVSGARGVKVTNSASGGSCVTPTTRPPRSRVVKLLTKRTSSKCDADSTSTIELISLDINTC